MTFCGHIVDKDGLHTCKNKVETIEKAPAPKNVTELRSYLGLLNFYGKFLRNLSSILAPLHQLLKKDAKWVWKGNQQRAFNKTKEMLQSATVLTHYDDKKELLLSCDASPYGLGAVLSHRMPDGSEKQISFVKIISPSREELFPIRQSCGICSEEVSPVSVWKTVFNFHRSQTTSGVVWTQTNTNYGFTAFTEMDTIVVRL